MLCTVSTVKDTLSGVESFVSGNLANGVDHLFVFLETEEREVRDFLDGHEHVTCVPAGASWWRGRRPDALNTRQRINANAVKAVLGVVGGADWLFHIDADERVHVDRAVVDDLGAEVDVVQLTPLESVSRLHPAGGLAGVREFKRPLDDADLTLLHVLGVISRPSNGAYFSGHVQGKSGVRPRLDRWLSLHHIVGDGGTSAAAHSDPRLRLLHYESWSGEEFVRKWTSLVASGSSPSLRPMREPVAVAVAALCAKQLQTERLRTYLERVFERTRVDDVDTLRDLGLLVRLDPAAGTHVPGRLPELERAEALLAALAEVSKQPLLARAGVGGTARVLAAAARLVPGRPDLATRVERALAPLGVSR